MPKSRAKLRRLAQNRAAGRCEYCRSPDCYSPQPFSLEHISPRSAGGNDSLDNRAWSCQGCNNHKYTRLAALDTLSGMIAPLFHPRTDVWDDHFRWSDDYTQILGITATGRVTVLVMNLNRQELVNLRQLLVAFGEHPPPRKDG
jgi:HNH endonuclease